MKFKTWEKIYWAVIITFIVLMILGFHTDPNNYVINGKPMTVTKAYFVIFAVWGGLFSLIWLIARYFVNKGDKKN